MIETTNLTKKYRTDSIETTALDRVSLRIEPSEFVAITGPSGCGKSTLLNVIGLLDDPTGGDLVFLGRNVVRLAESEKARIRKENIGFVFQTFNLIDDLTVFENVELPLVYLGVPRPDRAARVEAVLERMEIGARRDHYPRQLSGGQQQRVAVARAVVTRPKLVLADEPTGNLDSTRGDEVMKALEELNREGTTLVMVTHSPAGAARAGRVIRLLDGRVVESAAPEVIHA